MDTFRALIADYGLANFAADIGVLENTAKQMRKRDSVSPEYWLDWVESSKGRGKTFITLERLAQIASRKKNKTHRASAVKLPLNKGE